MGAPAVVITGTVPRNSPAVLFARILGLNGSPITQASLTGIAYTAKDLNTGTTLTPGVFTISTVIFNSLQQGDIRWSQDSLSFPGNDGLAGYNFAATAPASLFATIGDVIEVDVAFTPVTGDSFHQPYQLTVI